MKLDNESRMAVINELLDELKSYGHYTAITHVEGCKKRLQTRMDRVAYWESKTGGKGHARQQTVQMDGRKTGTAGS